MKSLNLIIFICLSITCFSQENIKYTSVNLDTIFGNNKGTFVLYEQQNDSYKIYNYKRANERYAVHSTSKILWSIIGLEEKLIKNENELVKWDSIKHPKKEFLWMSDWFKDQTVKTALNKSVNWYYFELLALMNPKMIEKYLNKFDYQKGFKVEKIDYFGLTFNIKKSAIEQIDFLKRLYTNDLKISEKNLRIIKEALIYKQSDDYTIYAKTGLGPVDDDNAIGWFIGIIEKKGEIVYFALNIEGEDELKLIKQRIEIALKVIKALKLTE